MEKAGGRPRDGVWQHVQVLEGGRRVKCIYCEYEFAASANRIKSHINKDKGKGIRVCPNFPQSHNFASDNKGNSNHLKDNFPHSQGDAKYEERIQIGSSSVSNWDAEDLQMIQYVFECLSPTDKVYESGRLYLNQKEFITLKPETFLDSWVIDVFVEILTESEKKKATPSNCYLPVTVSKEALKHVEHNFKDFVQRQNIRENYLFHIKSPEKVFIPVHTGQETHGHFYLYIFHLNKKVVEIWDSLPIFVAETERDETKKKLFYAMEILFNQKKGAFSDYQKEMANDIRFQDNGFDCGLFVINYMQQSDNYVKRDSSFQFDSQKEREDLALKLLNNDLNKEKQNLYDKARRHYAQVEKQDDNKRLRVDPSKEHIEAQNDDSGEEDDGLEKVEDFDDSNEEDDDSDEEEDDDSDEEDDGLENSMSIDSDEDDDGLENDLIGMEFQRYTEQIREWIEDDKVSAIGVWGMAGSGKTALASHIYDKLLEEGDIKVIWVTVSQNSIHNLQKVIARSIMLDISEEFEVKIIARKLFQAFKEMKKCVVILDDVWDHFFLKGVGFPMSDNRIKLILTTRIREVCQGMCCDQNRIEVGPLSMNDSWALFKKTIGSYKGLSSEVKTFAMNVASECNGLPLAIVRIATSMKGKKQVVEWSHMWECLKNLGHRQYEMDKWIFPILRSSYDFLSKKLKRFFLYCALCTKGVLDVKTANHLIRIFLYESIDETKKLKVQYDEGYNMLDRLNNHSMLERYDEPLWNDNKQWMERYDKQWSMNKFLRALAIGIAEDTGKIMANAYKDLKEIPRDDQWKDDLQKVFLTGNKIKTIPNGTRPRCSLLSALFLDGNTDLYDISDDFFNNMPALKTLDLSKTGIKRLPESVSSLKCLNVLLLSRCNELSYIPPLRNLKWLILLDLCFTAITEAPLGLESLINLRYLNLLHTPNLVMSASVISKLINLECLELDVTTQVGIQGLENLEVIVAYFRDSSVFNTYMNSLAEHRVRRSYHLILRDSSLGRDHLSLLDSSDVSYYEGINTEYSMKRITFKDMDLRNIKPALLPVDMNELFIGDCKFPIGTSSLCKALSFGSKIERFSIRNCKDVKFLCCLSYLCPFCSSTQLVGRLRLSRLDHLKDIVSPYALLSLHQSSLFSHLKHLQISDCDNMKTLMMPKLFALFRNLRTILIRSCWKMKEIVGEDDRSKMELGGSGDLSHPTPITLPRLTSLELHSLPRLEFICRDVMLCPSLQTFSAVYCYKLKPPRIEISNGSELPMENTSTGGYHWQIN